MPTLTQNSDPHMRSDTHTHSLEIWRHCATTSTNTRFNSSDSVDKSSRWSSSTQPEWVWPRCDDMTSTGMASRLVLGQYNVDDPIC